MLQSKESNSNSQVPPETPATSRFRYPRQVRMVDTDATGNAHFSAYIRMMEEAEYAFLRSRGLSVVLESPKGKMGFPRISCELEISRPLCLGDRVNVDVELLGTDGKRVRYQFRIMDDQGTEVVTGKVVAALCRFPADKLPYAILFPEGLAEKLAGPPVSNQDS